MLLLPAACDRLISGMPAPPAFGGGGCRESGHDGACGAAGEECGLPPPPPSLHLRWHTALLGAALLAQPGNGEPAGAAGVGSSLGTEWVRQPRPRTWPGRAVGSIRPVPPREGGDSGCPPWAGSQGHGFGTAASQPGVDSGPTWASVSRPACARASGAGNAGGSGGGGGGLDVRRHGTAWEADASTSSYLDSADPSGCSGEARAPAMRQKEAQSGSSAPVGGASPEPNPTSPLLRFDSASSEAAYARLGPGRQPPARRATAEPLLVVREPSPYQDTGASAGARPAGTDPAAGSVGGSQASKNPPDHAAGNGGGPWPLQGGAPRAAASSHDEGAPPRLQRARWSIGAARPAACVSDAGMRPASKAVSAAQQPCAAAARAAEAAATGAQTRDCNGWREAARPGAAVERNSERRREATAAETGIDKRMELFTEERQRVPRRRRPPPLHSKTVRRCLGGAFAAAAEAARPPAGDAASSEPGRYPAWLQRAPEQGDTVARSDRGWFPFATGLLAPAPLWQECGGVEGVSGKHACAKAAGRCIPADRPPLKHDGCWCGGGCVDGDGGIKAWRAGDESAGPASPLNPGDAPEAAMLIRNGAGTASRPHAGLMLEPGHERTLGEVLRAVGGAPLPEAAARAVAANAALALAELHADGLVHRALGPDALVLGDGACFDTARCPAAWSATVQVESMTRRQQHCP